MELVLRALVVYVIIWLVLRLSGKRTFSDMTTFDFVLLLIISESTQQALLGEDHSITASAIVIVTLVSADVGLSLLKRGSKRMERLIDGMPLLVVRDGRPLREPMDRERIDEEDVMDEARRLHGLERMDQIKYAVMERNGAISIIPRRPVT